MVIHWDAERTGWWEISIGLIQDSLNSVFYKPLIFIKFASDMKFKTESLWETETESKISHQAKTKIIFQDKMK